MEAVIWGLDPGVGSIPFGFISVGKEGPIATFRGTQEPKGSVVEWLDDFDAFLEPCPIGPGNWHRGFGKVFGSLSIEMTDGTKSPLQPVLGSLAGLICHGHSLGAPLATYAALQAKAPELVLFASPKAGDSDFAGACRLQWYGTPVVSYANPNDAVPKVPITADWPWKLEDFQQVAPITELQPTLVTPAIPADWGSSHNLANYLALLTAV
jgi:hypothetical protein